MTGSLYIKNNKYHVMLNWQQDGKRKQKSVTTGFSTKGNNKRKAEQKLREILAEWESKITECHNYQDILFTYYLQKWLGDYRKSIAETTYQGYKSIIERQITPYFEPKKLKLIDVRAHHIQDFYNWKMRTNKVVANTIHHYHANIHKALKDAVQLEIIPSNPAERVILPKKQKHLAEFYDVPELKQLFELVKGTKLETPVYLAGWYGLRRGEVVGVRWQDIDFENNTLTIRGVVTDRGDNSQTENLAYRPSAKTRAGLRSFPLWDEVREYFLKLKECQEAARKLAGNSYNNKWRGFVCVDRIGNLIQPEYISYTFPKFLDKHELRRITFHQLRHSNISLLLNKGIHMKQIQEWAGHSDYSTTANIYAHLLIDSKKELAETLRSSFK